MGGDGNGNEGAGETGHDIRERRIEYRPLPSQKKFHESRARFKGFSGPIGSGKSQALCQEALKLAYVNPGRTGLIGAPTYPTDVNQTAFNQAINYAPTWTPSVLTVLKTESIGFTMGRNLNESLQTMEFGVSLGIPASQRSQLVSISDATTPWMKEVRIAAGMHFESVVLFALDQFCLIAYPDPLPSSARRIIRSRR